MQVLINAGASPPIGGGLDPILRTLLLPVFAAHSQKELPEGLIPLYYDYSQRHLLSFKPEKVILSVCTRKGELCF